MRDDFSEEVKRTIAARVGYRCSSPTCRAPTSGPQLDPSKSLNVGVASHITAASPGGPRYDPTLTPDERKHSNNAIWLCQTCGKLVDNDKLRFTEEELRRWKRDAENEALLRIGKAASSADPTQADWSEEELVLLSACAEDGEIFVHSSDETGKFIGAGRRHFYDQSDPAVAALYIDALYSLHRRGLAVLKGGSLYQLTGRGFKVARALKKQELAIAEQTEKPLPQDWLRSQLREANRNVLHARIMPDGRIQLSFAGSAVWMDRESLIIIFHLDPGLTQAGAVRRVREALAATGDDWLFPDGCKWILRTDLLRRRVKQLSGYGWLNGNQVVIPEVSHTPMAWNGQHVEQTTVTFSVGENEV